MKKARLTRTLMAAVSIVALSAVMYGCVHNGDGDDSTSTDMTDTQPTPYEKARDAIAAADTAEAAQEAYDAVDQTTITGTEAASLQMALNSRLETLATAARAAMQRAALMTAAGAIDTSDLSTADAIAAATAAINALQAAIDAADDIDDTSMYESQVMTARMAVATAQNNLDTQGRMSTQRMEISNAVTMARTAVAGVDDDSTDSEVAAADSAIAALQAAIDGAADLPEGDADVASAQGTLDTLKGTLMAAKTSRTAAIEAANTAATKAMAKLGKDLRAALAGPTPNTQNALNNLEVTPPVFTTAGDLTINAAEGAGSLDNTAPHTAVNLEAGDAVSALGGWMGMDYAHSEGTGDEMVSNDARVYTNKGPDSSLPFSDTETGGRYPLITTAGATEGYVLLGETATPFTRAYAAAFKHSGTQSHQASAESDAFYTSGTYDGAPGRFRCAGDNCSSTNDGEGNVSTLGGTWHFKPNAGAMVKEADAHYLYYGWWVRKDADGMPTAASAFAGRAGTDPGDSTDGLDLAVAGNTLTGSATYAGNAAGKFAMSNPLDGTGSGGHFTADAELKATFGATTGADAVEGSGITGTIDNFRLNDGSDDPGWSVSLHRADWGADGVFATPTTDDANTPNVDETEGTTWSIGDNSAAGRSGTWGGQMYDEAPGNPSATGPGDGSNIPTTVTGTFYSEFSSIGRMVGAFGADKQ